MSRLQIEPLPHQPDAAQWLQRVRDLGRSVWLDSGRPAGLSGRYELVTAAPVATVEHPPKARSSLDKAASSGERDPFSALREAIGHYLGPVLPHSGIPFCGGAIGYFSYGSAGAPEPPGAPVQPAMPTTSFGIYTWAIVCDHELHQTHLVLHPATPSWLHRELLARLAAESSNVARPKETPEKFALLADWRVMPDEDGYRQAFGRIQSYIRAGDCYQVNLARHWHVSFEGDPWQAYQLLRARAAAPFSAWLEREDGAVMSLSPERFLRCVGDELWTQPIKGTARRDVDPAVDQALGEALLTSEKNRAENLMIVDLLRNDLGRSCIPGSIQVDKLFELQRFATVQHLVSSVRGRLRPGLHPLEALRESFPGGSITGAPKIRAMEIIAELEPFRRALFCGSIGYMSACGTMDTNIAIRTLVASNGELFAWAGGGIVADSDCDEEFAESAAKIEPLLAVLSGPQER